MKILRTVSEEFEPLERAVIIAVRIGQFVGARSRVCHIFVNSMAHCAVRIRLVMVLPEPPVCARGQGGFRDPIDTIGWRSVRRCGVLCFQRGVVDKEAVEPVRWLA